MILLFINAFVWCRVISLTLFVCAWFIVCVFVSACICVCVHGLLCVHVFVHVCTCVCVYVGIHCSVFIASAMNALPQRCAVGELHMELML